MSLLSRYILKEYLRICALTGFSLLSIFIIVGLFELLNDALEHKAAIKYILLYLLYKMPQAIHFMAPVVVLISTILCLGHFSASSELTAMKAGGLGISKITFPIFLVATIMSGVIFLNSEYLLPYANHERKRILRTEIKKEPMRGTQNKNNLWYRSDNGMIWKIGIMGEDGKSLRNISILEFNESRNLKIRTESKRAEWREKGWLFFDVWVRTFHTDGEFTSQHFDSKSITVEEAPEDLISIRKDPDKMSYKEIGEYIKKIKREGMDTTKYEVDRASKLSFPLFSIIMALVAIPFSIRSGRQGGITVGIGISVTIGFSVWFVHSILLSLGHSGKIPVLAAAWGADLMFFVLGCFLVLKNRR